MIEKPGCRKNKGTRTDRDQPGTPLMSLHQSIAKSLWNRMFDTHPPLEERIALLREL